MSSGGGHRYAGGERCIYTGVLGFEIQKKKNVMVEDTES